MFNRLLGGRLTPVTTWLLIIEFSAFLVFAFAGGPAAWRNHVALNPQRAIGAFELWQIVTAPWFHVSGFALLGSLIGLFVIGPLLERPLGSRRFLAFFIITGIVADLAAAIVGSVFGFKQVLGGCGPALIASMVAFGFIYRRQQLLLFGVTPMKGLHLSVFFTGLWLLLAALDRDGVALAAYLAAGVAGAALVGGRVRLGDTIGRLAKAWERVRQRRLRRRYKVIPGGRDKQFLN